MPDVAKTLPDPLHNAGLDPVANADELLSQLAGEEIDRLLAEAESPRSEPVAPAGATVVAESTQAAHAPAKAATPDPAVDPDLSRQLDDLFNELNEEIEGVAAAAPPAPRPAEPEVAPRTELEPANPVAPQATRGAGGDPAEDTQSLEKDVLAASVLAGIPEVPAKKETKPRPVAAEERESTEPLVSVLLRPVAWASGLLPEAALDWLGKVAILTTINAMAIFVYLLIRGR